MKNMDCSREHTRNQEDDTTKDCKKLHNEEVHNMYSSHNRKEVIKSRMRWIQHIAHTGEMRNAHKILVGRPQ
jgi:hypothetical protein